MVAGVAGIGVMELVILLVIGGGTLLGLVGVCVAIALASRSKGRAGMGAWTAPQTVGPPRSLQVLGPSTPPITSSASWDGSELVVRADGPSTKSLFDVRVDRPQKCRLTYRFRIKTDSLPGAVYPEMWCRIPDAGQFFSRGVDRKVRGAIDWQSVEIPFYLPKGQQADLLHLNLVFEGPGSVRLRDIEVLATETAG